MKIKAVLLNVAVFSVWMILGGGEVSAANVAGLEPVGVAKIGTAKVGRAAKMTANTPKAGAAKPAAPKNLEASVYGHRVTLSWANPDMGEVLAQTDFEDETVEQGDDISLEVNGWTVKSTNTSDYSCTWFNYPTLDFMGANDYEMLIYKGLRSAVVYMDIMEDDEHKMHQDEWLISPVLNKAAYLSFSSFIDPRILEAGADPSFPDHYAVVVSTDGGKTWSDPIWDARYDATPSGGWQTVTLSLAAAPTKEMQVAFRAYGEYSIDEETGDTINQGLHGVWAIDNVTITAAAAGAEATAPIAYYVVQLDGESLDSVQDLTYVDKSKKTPGEHTYSVLAVDVNDNESLPAQTKVNLKAFTFPAPQNFVCAPEKDEETGRYTVNITWEAPQTEFKPAYYTLYSDQAVAGTELTAEEGQEGIGISGCFGIYEFSIEAVYKSPDTVSERVIKRLALGVRFGVTDLQAKSEGADVALSWKAPQEDGFTVQSYTVYRSGVKIAENLTSTSCRDLGVADGLYQYTVIVLYADKVESVRTSIMYQKGEDVRMALPYEQHFNTTFLPEGWRIENQSQRTPDKYTWYFDDGSRLGVKGNGFEGSYAAIDCRDIGMYRLDAALLMPPFDLTTAVEKANVMLGFNYSYAIGGIFRAGVEWSIDGEEWYLLEAIDKKDGYAPVDDGDFHIQHFELRIGDVILDEDLDTAKTLYLRFRYEAARSHHWAIDNVTVGEKTAVERANLGGEAGGVTAWAAQGVLHVNATEAIEKVEIYGVDGVKMAERAGSGESALSWAVPTSLHAKKPVLVRVSTTNAVKVVKVLL